jgi:hypothetical protein
MVNDNNPELIEDDGILISTFPDGEAASVPVVLNGRFDLFSHHVYAGDAKAAPAQPCGWRCWRLRWGTHL